MQAAQKAVQSSKASSKEVRAGPLLVTTIPVYWNVISNATAGNIPDAVIRENINVINRVYAPGRFKFELRQIRRIRNAGWFLARYDSEEEYALKQALRVGGAETLNVYSLDLESDGLLGWASFPSWYVDYPWYDGVMLEYGSVPGGRSTDYNLGHTLTHEVGHWLGLFHTFEGGCNSLFGDMISDTPAEDEPAFGCPIGRDTCTGLRFPGADPVQNYMDYVDDACYTNFTPGQFTMMRLQWTAYRGRLSG